MRAPRHLSAFILYGTSLGVLACETPETFEISGDTLTEPDRLTMQVDMLRYVSEIDDYATAYEKNTNP